MTRQRSLRRYALAALCAVVVAAPVATLEVVVSRARECFAAIENDGTARDCRDGHALLGWLLHVPFMRSHAQRIRDELAVRWASAHYLDAAVGTPGAALLSERFAPLQAEARAIDNGSGRLRFDELGPPIGTPYPADMAFSAGDDASLDAIAATLTHHDHQRRALRAALLRGDIDRAVALGRLYLGGPSADVQILAAAVSCAGTDVPRAEAVRALEHCAEVEKDRADHRSANFSRNFGDARLVIEACAQRSGATAPAPPPYGHAGSWDHRARLMAMRMRRIHAQHAECDWASAEGCMRDAVVRDNVVHALEMLGSRTRQHYRLELAASVVEALLPDAERLLTVLPGEPGHLDRLPRLPDEWLSPAADEPFVPPARWEKAAALLEALERPALRQAVIAMWGRAAMGYWLAGEPAASALDHLERLAPQRASWLRATHALLSGAPLPPLGVGPVEALFRAEALVASGDDARPLAREAVRAAESQGDAALIERARWLAVALGEPHDRPSRPPEVVVLGNADIPQSAAGRRAALDAVLTRWSDRLEPSADHRAARYEIFHHRGDAPAALDVYLFALGKLLDPAPLQPAPPEVETWLSATLALDRERISLRRFAFAHWRAALWRRDEANTAMWRARLDALLRLSRDPERAELLQAAGI